MLVVDSLECCGDLLPQVLKLVHVWGHVIMIALTHYTTSKIHTQLSASRMLGDLTIKREISPHYILIPNSEQDLNAVEEPLPFCCDCDNRLPKLYNTDKMVAVNFFMLIIFHSLRGVCRVITFNCKFTSTESKRVW